MKTKYTPEQIAEAKAIMADLENDAKVAARLEREAKERELQTLHALAAEAVQKIRTAFRELEEYKRKSGNSLRLDLFDIHALAQELDTETDWDSSSLYC